MPKFVGRDTETALLSDAYTSADSTFIPIYGRRRVGKSALILKAFEKKPHLYFPGKQAPATMQRRAFLREAARTWNQPVLDGVETVDWPQAIDLALAHAPRDRKIVLTFDEFQWIAEASPELPSVLQEYWDRDWQASGMFVLVLCGSYLGFMEREVLGRKSPLFGRRTAQIRLKPFPFHESIRFHPSWSLTDRTRAYFICGGIPYYLRSFKPSQSIPENIRNTFLGDYALLHYEADFLLREELRELENYHAILTCLATGSQPNREIARRTGLDDRRLTHYLNSLVGLGYVSRRYPGTGKPPAARMVRFSLDDALLRFWFHFVFPHTSYLSQVPASEGYRAIVQPRIDAYWGLCFERLCREALSRIYVKEAIMGPFEVGEYWDKTVQIDVVGRRGDDWIDLGECRWGAVSSWPALEKEVSAKVRAFPNPNNATIQPRLFVRSRPNRQTISKTLKVHDLEEMSTA